VSQKTKLILRLIAVVVILLVLGMHLEFVIIPALTAYKLWLSIGASLLLLVAG
jgi:hypothetical protein